MKLRTDRGFISVRGLARLKTLLALVSSLFNCCLIASTQLEPIDDPYEEPTNADIVVDITTQTIPEIVHSTSSRILVIRYDLTELYLGIVLLLETNGLL